MKIYISGKISGIPFEQVIFKFSASEANLKSQGYDPVPPCFYSPFLGIEKWLFYLVADIWQLLKCEAIYIQKDWYLSTGAKIEVFVSILTNKKIVTQL